MQLQELQKKKKKKNKTTRIKKKKYNCKCINFPWKIGKFWPTVGKNGNETFLDTTRLVSSTPVHSFISLWREHYLTMAGARRQKILSLSLPLPGSLSNPLNYKNRVERGQWIHENRQHRGSRLRSPVEEPRVQPIASRRKLALAGLASYFSSPPAPTDTAYRSLSSPRSHSPLVLRTQLSLFTFRIVWRKLFFNHPQS